jgi:hypothetical protein
LAWSVAAVCYRPEWQYFHYDPEKPTHFSKLIQY